MNKTLLFAFSFMLSYCGFSQGIVRGPFLQSATQTGIIVKWKSEKQNSSFIKYGINRDNLNDTIREKGEYIDHLMVIENLKAGSQYYYSINGDDDSKAEGSFYTLPPKGSTEKFRFVAFGDCGTGTQMQKEVLSSVLNHLGEGKIDGMLLLGDNAYNYGWESEYQEKFFPIYQKGLLANTVLWPSPGNHDYGGRLWPNDWGSLPDYFDIFTLPTKGQSGGLPSNTEAYYSFDIGNVHFVSLDSYGREDNRRLADLQSKQIEWLRKDLAANELMWTVAFFHHPPFTKGSHDSDAENIYDEELGELRRSIVPVFDEYGVDLVLTGHSHSYERSYPLAGFWGTEDAFSLGNHAMSNSSGRYDFSENSCPYVKDTRGTVYMVAGTAGWSGGTSAGYPHNAMYYSNVKKTGAVILEVDDNVLSTKYLSSEGEVLDELTLMKRVNQKKEYIIDCGDSLWLESSWGGAAFWDNNLQNSQNYVLEGLAKDSTFIITDEKGCLSDTFNIMVNPPALPIISSNSPVLQGSELELTSNQMANCDLKWRGPNGFFSTEVNPKLTITDLQSAGEYSLISTCGNCTSSAVLNVDLIPLLSSEKEVNISLFPNPTNSHLKLEFIVPETGAYKIELFSLTGKRLLKEAINLIKGNVYQNRIDLRKLKGESQMVIKVSGGGLLETRIIVIR